MRSKLFAGNGIPKTIRSAVLPAMYSTAVFLAVLAEPIPPFLAETYAFVTVRQRAVFYI